MTIRQDLQIRQGETWEHVYIHADSAGSAIDLSGFTARMSIKADFDGGNEAYLSTESDADGGSIVLGGANGVVTLTMTAEESAGLGSGLSEFVFLPGDKRVPAGPFLKFIYDLELVSSAGEVTRALEGAVLLQRGVTR